ncbi:hypothetical protein JKP88DRAFT_263472, partial [Tribonema minus]
MRSVAVLILATALAVASAGGRCQCPKKPQALRALGAEGEQEDVFEESEQRELAAKCKYSDIVCPCDQKCNKACEWSDGAWVSKKKCKDKSKIVTTLPGSVKDANSVCCAKDTCIKAGGMGETFCRKQHIYVHVCAYCNLLTAHTAPTTTVPTPCSCAASCTAAACSKAKGWKKGATCMQLAGINCPATGQACCAVKAAAAAVVAPAKPPATPKPTAAVKPTEPAHTEPPHTEPPAQHAPLPAAVTPAMAALPTCESQHGSCHGDCPAESVIAGVAKCQWDGHVCCSIKKCEDAGAAMCVANGCSDWKNQCELKGYNAWSAAQCTEASGTCSDGKKCITMRDGSQEDLKEWTTSWKIENEVEEVTPELAAIELAECEAAPMDEYDGDAQPQDCKASGGICACNCGDVCAYTTKAAGYAWVGEYQCGEIASRGCALGTVCCKSRDVQSMQDNDDIENETQYQILPAPDAAPLELQTPTATQTLVVTQTPEVTQTPQPQAQAAAVAQTPERKLSREPIMDAEGDRQPLREAQQMQHVQHQHLVKSRHKQDLRLFELGSSPKFQDIVDAVKSAHGMTQVERITYKDNDGDDVTLGCDSELELALRLCSPPLRIAVQGRKADLAGGGAAAETHGDPSHGDLTGPAAQNAGVVIAGLSATDTGGAAVDVTQQLKAVLRLLQLRPRRLVMRGLAPSPGAAAAAAAGTTGGATDNPAGSSTEARSVSVHRAPATGEEQVTEEKAAGAEAADSDDAGEGEGGADAEAGGGKGDAFGALLAEPFQKAGIPITAATVRLELVDKAAFRDALQSQRKTRKARTTTPKPAEPAAATSPPPHAPPPFPPGPPFHHHHHHPHHGIHHHHPHHIMFHPHPFGPRPPWGWGEFGHDPADADDNADKERDDNESQDDEQEGQDAGPGMYMHGSHTYPNLARGPEWGGHAAWGRWGPPPAPNAAHATDQSPEQSPAAGEGGLDDGNSKETARGGWGGASGGWANNMGRGGSVRCSRGTRTGHGRGVSQQAAEGGARRYRVLYPDVLEGGDAKAVLAFLNMAGDCELFVSLLFYRSDSRWVDHAEMQHSLALLRIASAARRGCRGGGGRRGAAGGGGSSSDALTPESRAFNMAGRIINDAFARLPVSMYDPTLTGAKRGLERSASMEDAHAGGGSASKRRVQSAGSTDAAAVHTTPADRQLLTATAMANHARTALEAAAHECMRATTAMCGYASQAPSV